jgi:cytoskeletal protein RodZ
VFEIGSSLRAAREHQQLELGDVERTTHIRARYLLALEEERWDLVPGTAYVKGFLRTYADYLGLDGPRFVAEFSERFAPAEEFEPPTLVRVRRRRRFLNPSRASAAVAILLAIAIGLFSWRLAGGGSGGKTAHAPPPPPPSTSTVTHATTTTAPARPQPALARVEVDATRGSCWLAVRLGSDTGRTLYERTLQSGQRVRFVARRLWIRYGAPWNVDATVNGKAVRLPSAIADVVYP